MIVIYQVTRTYRIYCPKALGCVAQGKQGHYMHTKGLRVINFIGT